MDRQCKGGHRINCRPTDIEGNGLDKDRRQWRSFIRTHRRQMAGSGTADDILWALCGLGSESFVHNYFQIVSQVTNE